MSSQTLFERIKIKTSHQLSECGAHEPQHKSKEYKYLPSPSISKTPHLILCCCINIGTDPPGFKKPHVTSTTFGWINTKDHKKREVGYDITASLASQYQRFCTPSTTTELLWDPTTDRVKKACLAAHDRHSKDRILFHYNGHGVPLPTINHEYVFNCLGEHAIYVFDCPYSARLFKWFTKRNELLLKQHKHPADYIVFSGYGDLEAPQTNPNFPVDIFSTFEHKIKQQQPYVELYAILTAIIEGIAWNVLPHDMFMKLFRKDIAVASLFRHFILARRVLKTFSFTPQSYPPIPDTSSHPLWKTWDAVLELAIPKLIHSTKQINVAPSPFFNNLIVSLREWLASHPTEAPTPCPLPMIFRLFLRKDYTCEVFGLICDYVDLGYFACERAVNIGFIPLLAQSLEKEQLQHYGIFCLTKVLAFDHTIASTAPLKNSVKSLLRIVETQIHPFQTVYILADWENKGVHIGIIKATSHQSELVRVWALVCLSKIVSGYNTKSQEDIYPLLIDTIKNHIHDRAPHVRSAVLHLLVCAIKTPTSILSSSLLKECQPLFNEIAKDGCPTVRSLLVVVLFKIISTGNPSRNYEQLLLQLSNDTDADVIRSSETLLSLIQQGRGPKMFGRKPTISPLEQFIKTSQKTFHELIQRFYCAIRDVFRQPLLYETINEEIEERSKWYSKQSNAVQNTARDFYLEIPTHRFKEKCHLTTVQNTFTPKMPLFHPSLPVMLSSTNSDMIAEFEYTMSQTPTFTFSNYNAINTNVCKLDWMNRSDDALLLTGCTDGSVRIWSNWDQTPKCLTSWRGVQKDMVKNAQFSLLSHDGICVSGDKEVFVWDTTTEQSIDSFTFNSPVTSLNQFSEKCFLYGCVNGQAGIVDIRSKSITQWNEQQSEIINVGYSTRTYTIVSTSKGSKSKSCLYDIRKITDKKQSTALFTVNIPGITAATVHEEAPYFAVGTTNDYVKVFSATNGKCSHEIKGYENFLHLKTIPVSHLAFPCYEFSLAVTTNNGIIVYNLI
ncbi:WD domain containing protein [Entamoeba marina]